MYKNRFHQTYFDETTNYFILKNQYVIFFTPGQFKPPFKVNYFFVVSLKIFY